METRQDSEEFYARQNSEEFYGYLLEFDKDPKKTMNINYVKEILYKFSYCNLEDAFDNPELIRKSVINYLYTGSFKLEKDNEITKSAKECLKTILKYEDDDKILDLRLKIKNLGEELKKSRNQEKKEKTKAIILKNTKDLKKLTANLNKKLIFKTFYSKVHSNWEKIHRKHEELISKFIKSENNKEVKYLIVYEAPPYSKTEEKYFLFSNGGTYGNPIKECFSNSESEENISNILFNKDAIYFDLIMAGIPIKDAELTIDKLTRSIRYFWSTNSAWKIGEKQLPIILLELGIFHLLNKGVVFDNRPFIAIGAPLNTSASIFEYYSKKYLMVYFNKNYIKKEAKKITNEDFQKVVFKVDSTCTEEYLIANLSVVNTPSTYEIRGTTGETYPLFKSNFSGSSNFPNGSLLKNAFNII